MTAVPRELFVGPPRTRPRAYENVALPIDCGQTISQPLVVARMLELLELGPPPTACSTSAPARATTPPCSRDWPGEVWTIERHAGRSWTRPGAPCARVGADNVVCVHGDGRRGGPRRAPFDAINVAAAPAGVGPRALEASARPTAAG